MFTNANLLKTSGVALVLALLAGASAANGSMTALAQPQPTFSDLQTVAGVAALTAVLLGLMVKPFLKIRLTGPPPEEVVSQYYAPLVNLCAFAIALLLSVAACFTGADITYSSILNSVLVAILATASAVGGYEVSRGLRR